MFYDCYFLLESFTTKKLANGALNMVFLDLFIFKDFIYLFMTDTERGAETQAEGEAGSLQGNPMWNSISGPWDHDLSQRDAQPLSHPGALESLFFLHSTLSLISTVPQVPWAALGVLNLTHETGWKH